MRVLRVLLGVTAAFLPLAMWGISSGSAMMGGALYSRANELLSSGRVSETPPGQSVAYEKSRVGTNVDQLSYWSTATPFLDLMKSSGDWLPQAPPGVWSTEEKLDLDENGWVRSLPTDGPLRHRSAGLVVLRGGDAGSAPPHARYVVLYDGEGVIDGMQGSRVVQREKSKQRLLIEAADNGWLHISIRSTDPNHNGNYLRNIRIVREDLFPRFQRGEIFHPTFLKKASTFQVIRFMNWMATNKLIRPDGTELVRRGREPYDLSASYLLNWSDRPRPSEALWTRGVPVEIMVALANRSGADPWFNMPINASDDYLRGFANYVRTNLNPGRKIHVELSNEVWNLGYVQARYAEARAKETFGPQASYIEWYGKRAAEMAAIWNSAFGEPPTGDTKKDRVRVVYGTQIVWKGRETPGLETPHWFDGKGKHRRAADYFDEYAITGYYNFHIPAAEKLATVTNWWSDPDGGYNRALKSLSDGVRFEQSPLYSYHAERSRQYGLALVTYESGYGELTPPNQHLNQRYTDFLVALQRRPEIYRVELANFEAFRRAGGSLFMNYGLIGKPTKYGSWSIFESIDQPTSPRYEALLDMLQAAAARPTK
ncbi:hypothetical protein [Sphingomonas hankyongi]|uniref:Cellulose-binding protein n=1 Tax=Sphingomonas hankyongi TaxID=2908209 RepID=A0ABT0S2N8_9SPHN|nr:hypothetical protein [Sphingomonas hankyongi]MCL6730132.1 hypothetical protein [Sphingomonas hankyongi]